MDKAITAISMSTMKARVAILINTRTAVPKHNHTQINIYEALEIQPQSIILTQIEDTKISKTTNPETLHLMVIENKPTENTDLDNLAKEAKNIGTKPHLTNPTQNKPNKRKKTDTCHTTLRTEYWQLPHPKWYTPHNVEPQNQNV
jgi:hypothetical protein